jgi:hypothetical protein
MNAWLARGYDAVRFCEGVCGWDYFNQGCVYTAQKRRPERALYVQHQHITLGHPLPFDVVIGDESPISAFLHEWEIPARWVLPPGMDPTEPLTEILAHLAQVVGLTEKALMGPPLLELLAPAAEIVDACERFELPIGALVAGDRIHRPEEASERPYFHLPELVALLGREARAAAEGRPCPSRIIASPGKLTLLLRRRPDPAKLPPHIIWLDGTGQPRIYQELFQRPVEVVDIAPPMQGRIFQVVDRSNGKTSLTAGRDPGSKRRVQQAERMVERIVSEHGYQRPVVITYKGLAEQDALFGEIERAHFYAARGTNAYETADAIFILGAPQPATYDVVKLAKMVFFEREAAFRVEWVTQPRPYAYVAPDGLGRTYPTSGFWHDADLQVLLEALREDEIIQAAHRGRPINQPVDIWLLTNVPVWGLPPTELLTMRDVLGAPEGVDVFRWAEVQALIDSQDTITVADIKALGLHYDTASSYVEKIAELPGWEKAAIKTGRRGLPPKAAQRTNTRG